MSLIHMTLFKIASTDLKLHQNKRKKYLKRFIGVELDGYNIPYLPNGYRFYKNIRSV